MYPAGGRQSAGYTESEIVGDPVLLFWVVFQPEFSAWGIFVDRYGLPLVILLIFILFFWKLFWPLLIRAQSALEVQVVEARAVRERDTSKFLESLAARDAINAKQTEAIENLTDRISDVRQRPTRP